jgi:alpha-tubulin suppressor-like RCC1 family protein
VESGLEDECVAMVSCGNRHTLVVTEDGEVFSMGLGHFGVLGRTFTPFEYDADAAVMNVGGGHPEEAFAGVPRADVPPVVEAVEPAPGNEEQGSFDLAAHLDLIANLTLEDSSDQCVPTLIDSLQGIKIVGSCAGHRHSMFLDERGGLYTCGSGAAGALGHGDLESQFFPMKVMEFGK